jgi:hypothetical protein
LFDVRAEALRDHHPNLIPRVNTVFTDVPVGDYSIGVLADSSRSDLVTTNRALDPL